MTTMIQTLTTSNPLTLRTGSPFKLLLYLHTLPPWTLDSSS